MAIKIQNVTVINDSRQGILTDLDISNGITINSSAGQAGQTIVTNGSTISWDYAQDQLARTLILLDI